MLPKPKSIDSFIAVIIIDGTRQMVSSTSAVNRHLVTCMNV